MDLKKEMAACAECAGSYLRNLKTKEYRTQDELYEDIRGYALAKLLLSQHEKEDEIDHLAAVSISNILQIPPEMLKQNDKPSGCTTATAVSDKKVLLILSISKALEVKLKAGSTPEIKTLERLSECFWLEMQKPKI